MTMTRGSSRKLMDPYVLPGLLCLCTCVDAYNAHVRLVHAPQQTQKVLELKALLQESFTLDASVMKEMNEGFKAVEIARDELRQLWMNA